MDVPEAGEVEDMAGLQSPLLSFPPADVECSSRGTTRGTLPPAAE